MVRTGNRVREGGGGGKTRGAVESAGRPKAEVVADLPFCLYGQHTSPTSTPNPVPLAKVPVAVNLPLAPS